MQKIASFTIDHERLLPGVYLSRQDKDPKTGCVVSTFDLRFVAPNREPALDVRASHTIEHLGATYLRNSDIKDKIVYFGPMGCLTGFYLVMFGDLSSADIYDEIVNMAQFIVDYAGEIPGTKAIECGNYLLHDLELARQAAKKYLQDLKQKNLEYPG